MRNPQREGWFSVLQKSPSDLLWSGFLSAPLFNHDLPDQLTEDLWPHAHTRTHTHSSFPAAFVLGHSCLPAQLFGASAVVVMWSPHTEGRYRCSPPSLCNTRLFAGLLTAQTHSRDCTLFISVPCLPKCLHLSFSSATHLLLQFVLRHPLSAANPSIHSPRWSQI